MANTLKDRHRQAEPVGRRGRSIEGGLFHIHLSASERVDVNLQAIRRSPDLLILDLTRNARNRLGWDWVDKAVELVACLREVHPTTGILAVADDPWTYRTVRFDILGTRRPGRNGKIAPASGHVEYSEVVDIVRRVAIAESAFEGGGRIDIDDFFGDAGHGIEAIRRLANDLSDKGDPHGATTARNLIATVRRTASLPGSLAELSRFLERETPTAAADDLLSVYRVTADLITLNDPRSLASLLDAENGALRSAGRAP